MDTKHLDMIVCPVTKSPLQRLDSERLAQMNTAIDHGGVQNHAELSVSDPLSEALVTRDGRVIYPVIDGIPMLLEEESIDWNQMAE